MPTVPQLFGGRTKPTRHRSDVAASNKQTNNNTIWESERESTVFGYCIFFYPQFLSGRTSLRETDGAMDELTYIYPLGKDCGVFLTAETSSLLSFHDRQYHTRVLKLLTNYLFEFYNSHALASANFRLLLLSFGVFASLSLFWCHIWMFSLDGNTFVYSKSLPHFLCSSSGPVARQLLSLMWRENRDRVPIRFPRVSELGGWLYYSSSRTCQSVCLCGKLDTHYTLAKTTQTCPVRNKHEAKAIR